jgi:hypothetical protein
MFLSFAYLGFSAVLKLLVGRRGNEFAKDVELIVLRHQLVVLGRQAARPSLGDSLIAPARVLAREPHHQLAHARSVGGRPALPRGYVQRPRTSWRCQRRSVAGVTTNPCWRRCGSNRASAAMKARSAGRSGARACWRVNTDNWCRSTSGSTSLASSVCRLRTSSLRTAENAR